MTCTPLWFVELRASSAVRTNSLKERGTKPIDGQSQRRSDLPGDPWPKGVGRGAVVELAAQFFHASDISVDLNGLCIAKRPLGLTVGELVLPDLERERGRSGRLDMPRGSLLDAAVGSHGE